MRIAIVGTGIAGSAAAWALAAHHTVTVYEKELRPGGHSHTIDVDYDGTCIPVDTGFIVYNELNYPNLTALLAHLGVETVESDMSFSLSADHGRFEWMAGGRGLKQTLDCAFAQRRNLLSPPFWWGLRELARFNRVSREDRAAGWLAGCSLADYLRHRRFSARFLRDYLVPIGAAIWSTPVDKMLDFPAENFIAFFDNHRLLHADSDRPAWRTVKGGSRRYVEKLAARFRDRMRLGAAVTRITRAAHGVTVADSLGHSDTYDHVVIAAHCDQTLAMLSDATADERAVLGAIAYRPNEVFLHRDTRLMPRRRRAWASWNFLRAGGRGVDGGEVAVTYWMNSLQRIDERYPLFVSLNPPFEPEPALTFAHFCCEHPQFDAAAFAAQARLETIQGARRTWFCGAWAGYGFHEDGLGAGLKVAEALGARVPWRTTPMLLAAE